MSEWRSVRADEAFSILMGRQRSPARATGPSMTPYLRSANVGDGRLDLSDVKQMDFSATERERFGLRRGDVLVSEGSASASAVGMASVWREDLPGDVCFQNTLLRFRAVPGTSEPGFVLQWCRWAYESGAFRDTASGTNIKHIGSTRAAAMPILLPPLHEQRRIVDLMSRVDSQVDSLVDEQERAVTSYRNALSLLWLDADGTETAVRRLSSVMTLAVERVVLEPDKSYRGAGVLGAGEGLIDKGSFQGSETEYGAMNVLRAGQVVMRKLTAWEGPISVVPSAFDGFVASNEFPTFTLGEGVAPEWVKHVCRTQRLWDEMKNRVTGSVQRRKRLNPDQLLEVALPVPPREAQERTAHALDLLNAEVGSLNMELARLRMFRATLLASLLNQDVEIPESYDALLEAAS